MNTDIKYRDQNCFVYLHISSFFYSALKSGIFHFTRLSGDLRLSEVRLQGPLEELTFFGTLGFIFSPLACFVGVPADIQSFEGLYYSNNPYL